ncbi:S1 family peptidase [Streptomyces sp. NPDC050617]|uniref:S1 family peptidase n=1 Tax=Streptomyces sp. NPDC050617 TaxID=3154628 RepID=UPI0034230F70
MSGKVARSAWATGFLATGIIAGLLTSTQAHAVVGDEAKDGQYAFTAKLAIGDGKRSCSGALVESQWVLTASRCFADDPERGFQIAGGAPKDKTVVTVGRTDLTGGAGAVVDAVELVPRGDRDLVMVKLARPVTGIAPVSVGTSVPGEGEEVRVAGYGRTKDEWVPDRLHSAAFAVGSVKDTAVGLSAEVSGAASVCRGDTGGPAFRESGGRIELVAVNSTAWQGGCFGSDEKETRTDAVETRVDDVADWVQSVSSRTLLPRADWKKADYLASGYFTGGSAGGKRHMDMIVRWADGSVTLYQGADHKDPKYPFSTQYQLAQAGSTWQYARAITAGSFTGSGSDGLVVRWVDGEVTEYAHVDRDGFHGEKTLFPERKDNPYWKNARVLTVGAFAANSRPNDVLVRWVDGELSYYPGVDGTGTHGEIQLVG